ncbi:MAG: hypothetical protein Q9165_004150 [Trypethelium subeluteriae]
MPTQTNGTIVVQGRPPSDLSDLWRNAFRKYNEKVGEKGAKINVDGGDLVTNLADVVDQIQDDAKKFSLHRHSNDKLDNIRSTICANLGIAQVVGDQLAKAVSTSFPAASPIWTVATYAIQASQRMSADYDKLEALFEETGGFLKTLKILEDRVPDNQDYTNQVTDIIESIIVVFAIHTKYMNMHRPMKFLKSLSGEDGELADAYTNVTKALEKLSACSTQMTLRNTEDIKLFLTENQESVNAIQQQVAAQLGMLQDLKESQEEHFSIIEAGNVQIQTTQIQGFQHLEQLFKDRLGDLGPRSDKQGQSKATDPAARTLAAINHVRQWCFEKLNGSESFLEDGLTSLARKLEKKAVNTGYAWFFEDEKYVSWTKGEIPLLIVHGSPGIGKSVLAHFASKDMIEKSGLNREREVTACFHFQETREELRSVKNALLSLVYQITQYHAKYSEEVEAILTDDSPLCDGIPEVKLIWEELLCQRFTKQSDRTLYLLLDGLDEMADTEMASLVLLLTRISTEGLRIRVLLACRSERLCLLEPLQSEKLEIHSHSFAPDIHAFVHTKIDDLPRVGRFSVKLKKLILSKLVEKADGILYADIVLHILDDIGREAPVRRTISKLPPGLDPLYGHFVTEAYRSKSLEYQKAYKTFYTWLAYSKRPMKVAEAGSVVTLMWKNGEFSVEDELDRNAGRLLELMRDDAEGEDEYSPDTTDEPHNDTQGSNPDGDDALESTDDETTGSLYFREKSFRDFLKRQNASYGILGVSPFEAHLSLMETLVHVLCTEMAAEKSKEHALVEYAAWAWDWHFLQLDSANASKDQIERVISAIYLVLRFNDAATYRIENSSRRYEVDCDELRPTAVRKAAVDALSDWIERAVLLQVNLEQEIAQWIGEIRDKHEHAVTWLVKHHVQNWLSGLEYSALFTSFDFALATMREVSQNPSQSFGVSFDHDQHDLVKSSKHDSEDVKWTILEIYEVANFLDTAQSDVYFYYALAQVLSSYEQPYLKEALEECNKSLTLVASDGMRFRVLVLKAGICKDMAIQMDNDDADTTEYGDSEDLKSQARQYLVEAFEFRQTAFGEPLSEQERIELFHALFSLGTCQSYFDADKSIAAYENSVTYGPRAAAKVVLAAVTRVLQLNERYEELLTKVEEAPFENQIDWLLYSNHHDSLQKAAFRSGHEGMQRMVRIYQRMIDHFDRQDRAAGLRINLGNLQRRMLGNDVAAKKLYCEILDSPVCRTASGNNSIDALVLARFNFAELLYEEFAASADPARKTPLLNEMKQLPDKRLALALGLGDDEKSMTSVILARMMRKMGPAEEYSKLMESIFAVCVNGLTDETTTNDFGSLRLLAKVLALAGLERDARIAFTAQFSVLEREEVHEEADGEAEDVTDEIPEVVARQEQGTATSETDGGQNSNAMEHGDDDGDTDAAAEEQAQEEAPEDTAETTEDLMDEPSRDCDGCGITFSAWNDGVTYLCAVCTFTELCQSCYERRINPAIIPFNRMGRSFCGENHEYIKGPIEDWKGIKDGVMTIGEEKVLFKEWLGKLQEERWVQAWKDFWKGA